MRALPIFFIIVLLCVCICIQGLAYGQTTNNTLVLLEQWNLINYPVGVAVDSSGDVYIAHTSSSAIKEVATNGTTVTVVVD